MLQELAAFVQLVSSASPFAVLAALCLIVFYVYSTNDKIDTVADNHLSHVQNSLDRLVDLSMEQRDTLNEVRDNTSYLKGKLDR